MRHAHASTQRGTGPSRAGAASQLPNGLYVRENDERDETTGQGDDARRRLTWRITARNPQFWWDIVLTRLDADASGIELHCTRCRHRDQAPSMDDVLRLIRAGAHFHNTDPAGRS